MGVWCGAHTADTTQKKTGMRLRPQVVGEFAKRERNGKKVVKSCARGRYCLLTDTMKGLVDA
jgi:hypothetical protein